MFSPLCARLRVAELLQIEAWRGDSSLGDWDYKSARTVQDGVREDGKCGPLLSLVLSTELIMYIGHRTEILKADVSSVSPSSDSL